MQLSRQSTTQSTTQSITYKFSVKTNNDVFTQKVTKTKFKYRLQTRIQNQIPISSKVQVNQPVTMMKSKNIKMLFVTFATCASGLNMIAHTPFPGPVIIANAPKITDNLLRKNDNTFIPNALESLHEGVYNIPEEIKSLLFKIAGGNQFHFLKNKKNI